MTTPSPPSGPYPPSRRVGSQPSPGTQQSYPGQPQQQPQPYPGTQQPYPGPQQQSYAGPAAYPAATRPGATPAFAAAGPRPGAAHAPVASVWRGGTGGGNGRVGMLLALAVVAFAAVWGLWIVLGQVGPQPAVIGFLAALVPLVTVLAVVAWLDRWEPEPRLMLLIALLWGAGVAVVISFYGNSLVMGFAYALTGDPETASTIAAVVSAPIVEESAKGVGVLLIFLLRRSFFDGVVDGIVYAAVVAAGFAFTENILYFGRYVDVLPAIFIQRGIMSPFAHVLFTACTGIALGLASRNRNRLAALWLFPLGLLAAMLLHALWNGTATLAGAGGATSFYTIYLVVQVPLFAAAVVLVVWLRRQESRAISARLGEYAAAGWFAPHEVAMVSSLRQRSQARSWATRLGPSAGAAMRDFIKQATSLAYLRQRAVSGRADLRSHSATEAQLLARVGEARRAFIAAAPAAVR